MPREAYGTLSCHSGSGIAPDDIVFVRENSGSQTSPFLVCYRYDSRRLNVSIWISHSFQDDYRGEAELAVSPSHFTTDPIPIGPAACASASCQARLSRRARLK